MRYLRAAVAALGLLTAGGDAATSTPRDASATPSASPYSDSVYVKNPHFLNHLEYFTSTGQVSWIENGWNEDDIGGGAAQLEGEASGGDVDETESGIEKRQMTNTSISTTVKNLTPNQPYTFRFSYLLQSASPANSCRLRAYFANNNYYNSGLWPLTTNPQTNWTVIAATVTPTASSGTLTISVDCTARGKAQIWVDNISVTQGALATSTTTSTTPSSTSTETPSATVDSTILILAKDETTAKLGSDGLLAYGIPFQHHIVPQAGIDLPVLNDTLTHGRFGGIIVMSAVSYDYGTGIGWRSAITDAQWASVYAYQSTFNVRLVRIDEYPGPSTGTTPAAGGCCDSTVDQKVYFTDTSSFPSAGLVTNAQVITTGLYHVPASITDASTTRQVAAFTAVSGNAGGVAGVINNFNGREQFVWFTTWAPSWSMTSSWLQHAHIHWMTRGVFVGKRKIFLNAQIDDVSLSTEIYYPLALPMSGSQRLIFKPMLTGRPVLTHACPLALTFGLNWDTTETVILSMPPVLIQRTSASQMMRSTGSWILKHPTSGGSLWELVLMSGPRTRRYTRGRWPALCWIPSPSGSPTSITSTSSATFRTPSAIST
ncbi:hypothetical protein V2G26_003679 [Clonostachys chloroleuca]